MNEAPSIKRYRGSKFLILVLLLLGVMGISYYSANRLTGDSETADKNAAMDAMIAGGQQQSEEPATRRAEMAAGSNQATKMGRDGLSIISTTSTDKTGQIADSAAAAGSAPTDMADALTVAVQGEIHRADSSPDAVGVQATRAVDTAKADLQTDADSAVKQMPESSQLVEIPASATLPVPGRIDGRMSASAATDAMPSLRELAYMGEKNLPSAIMIDSSKLLTATDSLTPATGPAMDRNGTAIDHSGRCVGPAPMGKDLGDRYIVAACETLSIISERTGVGLDALIEYNPQVRNPDRIYPMQRLWLPSRT